MNDQRYQNNRDTKTNEEEPRRKWAQKSHTEIRVARLLLLPAATREFYSAKIMHPVQHLPVLQR